MNFLKEFLYLSSIIYPKFCVQTSRNGKTLVFLIEDRDWDYDISLVDIFEDCTGYEALENHVHVFRDVKKKDFENAKNITLLVAENLFNTLRNRFPDRRFIVYASFGNKNGEDMGESMIVRFHQVWENEPRYYYPIDYWKDEIDKGIITIFE